MYICIFIDCNIVTKKAMYLVCLKPLWPLNQQTGIHYSPVVHVAPLTFRGKHASPPYQYLRWGFLWEMSISIHDSMSAANTTHNPLYSYPKIHFQDEYPFSKSFMRDHLNKAPLMILFHSIPPQDLVDESLSGYKV